MCINYCQYGGGIYCSYQRVNKEMRFQDLHQAASISETSTTIHDAKAPVNKIVPVKEFEKRLTH